MRRGLIGAMIVAADAAFYLVVSVFASARGTFTFWHPGVAAFCGCVAMFVGAAFILDELTPVEGCAGCRRLSADAAVTGKILAATQLDRDELRDALAVLKLPATPAPSKGTPAPTTKAGGRET